MPLRLITQDVPLVGEPVIGEDRRDVPIGELRRARVARIRLALDGVGLTGEEFRQRVESREGPRCALWPSEST